MVRAETKMELELYKATYRDLRIGFHKWLELRD
jgi:hypothetical protein